MCRAENLTFICKLVSGMNAFIAFNFVLVVSTFLTGYPISETLASQRLSGYEISVPRAMYDSITNPFIP